MTCCSPTQTDPFCRSLVLCCENITYITYDSMTFISMGIPNFRGKARQNKRLGIRKMCDNAVHQTDELQLALF